MHFYKSIVTVILFYVISVQSDGDIDFTDLKGTSAGRTVFNFLTIPVSAAQLSLGMTASPGNMDATDVPLAASGTAFFTRYKFAITHLEWLMGLRKEYVGACFPLLDQGTLSFYSQVFTLGSFDYAKDIDEYDSDPSSVEMAFGVAYARQFLYNKLSAGLTASYIESRLAGDGGRAFNGAVDAMYRPFVWFTTHIYARNLGNKVIYNETPEIQPFQTGLSLKFSPFAKEDSINYNRFDVSFALGAQKTIDAPLQIGIGTDVRPIKYFSIRAGYDYFYGHDFSLGGLSAGIGLHIKQYGVDAGWKYQSEVFGSVWALTIRYFTEEMIPKTAMDYYRVAERFFKKRRYKPCIFYAKKALQRNPNMWRAHALIAKAISEMHQKRGTEIVLIYTGNTNGEFLPTITRGVSTGGLARQAAVINTIRNDYPTSITIDAGNMVGRLSPPVKARFGDSYYQMMNYDAVGLGIGEIEFGFKEYCKKTKQSTMDFVCTNCAKKVGDCFTDWKIVSAGKYKIAVLGAIPGVVSQRKAKDTTLFARTMELIRTTQSPKVRMCNLRILIVNDTWETVQHYAKNIPLVDVIICGSLKQHFETPMKIGNKPIVSTGEFGKYVGALELRFDKNKKMLSYNNRLIPLTEEVIPHVEIDILANQISLRADLEKQGLTIQTLKKGKTEGVYTFISDRRGKPHVYLKVMKSKTEFPLTFGDTRCSKPLISFRNGTILYHAEHDTLDRKALMIMNINGSNKYEITCGGSVSEARYTSDEKWIYTVVREKIGKHTGIYRRLPSGGEPQHIIDWKDGSEQDITFSSDGINMVFTSDRDGHRQLYISDQEGNMPVRITDDPSHNYSPRFSPLDKHIAYLSEKNNFKGKKDLWIHDRNTGNKVRATRNANVTEFLWLDDEGTILYSSGINLVDFNTINVFTGENKKFIVTGSSKNYSETHPQVIFYKKRNRILYTREYQDGERKIYMVNPDGSEDRQVSLHSGNSWLE